MKYTTLKIKSDQSFQASKMWIGVVVLTVIVMVIRIITGSL